MTSQATRDPIAGHLITQQNAVSTVEDTEFVEAHRAALERVVQAGVELVLTDRVLQE